MAETLSIGTTAAPGSEQTRELAAPTPTTSVTISIENMRCGGCMTAIERALLSVPGVAFARANLSAKRVNVNFDPDRLSVEQVVDALEAAGFKAAVLSADDNKRQNTHLNDLLRRLAVAGFGAANVMLLSVSVWAGLASDMDSALQTLFHWLSAVIAIPVIAYAAKPFFRSAVTALSAGRLNMDVPISLGILLAMGMSLVQTARGTEQVYFDAAVMLTFFLLIGRFLDERMRATARSAAHNLMAFKALSATVIDTDGATHRVDARDVEPGARVLVACGESIPVDGCVKTGRSDIDDSLITGEPTPRQIYEGAEVHAGAVNLTAPIEMTAMSSAETSLLSEMGKLMTAAEQNRGRYRRLADRAAQIYAPAVHLLGAGTFLGWTIAGASWEQALTYAIAVVIITCPCALALAVPAVQVAAISRLFASGVIIKAPDGLERLAETNAVVFDKTGTLTTATMHLVNSENVPDSVIEKAASLAVGSRHPYAVAVVAEAEARALTVRAVEGVEEVPGAGLRCRSEHGSIQLGSAKWVDGVINEEPDQAQLWLRDTDGSVTPFAFADTVRPDAKNTVALLARRGFYIEIMSGDRKSAVADTARTLCVETWQGEVKPDAKLARIADLDAAGYKVLMVGDGLNDAPALAAGHASLSPSSASDVAQNAADGIFQGEQLWPIVKTIAVAKAAQQLALQNFGIAIAYNAVCVPLAAAGYVTPLIAALAMSGSSIAVTANALRLHAMTLENEGEAL